MTVDPDQYVIRGGLATPESLIVGVGPVLGHDFSGFSTVTAAGLSLEELAMAARYLNRTVSYTTAGSLIRLGYEVAPTPFPRMPLHASVITPNPLPLEEAVALSLAFSSKISNPWKP